MLHEKELLGVVCSCTHFLYWLEYRPFTILVDARSLLPLELGLGKKRKFARYRAVLDRLTFSMKAIPGSTNPADYGTRHSDHITLEEDNNRSFCEEGLLRYFKNDVRQCVLSRIQGTIPANDLSLSLTDHSVYSATKGKNCGLKPAKCDVAGCSQYVFYRMPGLPCFSV